MPAAPLSHPFAFAKGSDACSACAQQRSAPLVACAKCDAHMHADCYPSARISGIFLCDVCSVHLTDAQCVLCMGAMSQGVMQRVTDAEFAQINPAAAAALTKAGASRRPLLFAHTFCLQLHHSSPAPPKVCELCDRPSARLSCEVCVGAYHPSCALSQPRALIHSDNGTVLCFCTKHQKPHAPSPYPYAPSPPPPPQVVSMLKRPPPPAPTIAAKPNGHAATVRTAAAAASHARPTSPVSRASHASPPASSPGRKRTRAEAATAPLHAATAHSAAVAATPAPPALVVAAAKTALKSAAASSSKHADTTSSSSSSVAGAERVLTEKQRFRQTLSKKPAAGIGAAAKPAAAQRIVKLFDSSSSSSSSGDEASEEEDIIVRKSSKGSTAAATTKPAAAAAAAASTSKRAAHKSSASSKESGSAAAASASAAAPAKKHFSFHPDAAKAYELSTDEEDEAQYYSREEAEREKQLSAIDEIKQQREMENELEEGTCRVCGESWAEGDEGAPDADEMVICECCEESFHQSCYGIPSVPLGDYFCKPCLNKDPSCACKAKGRAGSIKCQICDGSEWRGFCEIVEEGDTAAAAAEANGRNSAGSARKGKKPRKKYAHTLCVHWRPETTFGIPEERNLARGIEKISKQCWNLKCCECPRPGGAKLQCMNGSCLQSFHPLCMLNHSDEFFFDERLEDNDIYDSVSGEMVRPPKLYFCKNCSPKKRLEVQRAKLLADGQSTEEIDLQIDALTPLVVPTTGLVPAHHLVGVVPLKEGRGSRTHRRVLRSDPTDELARKANFDRAQENLRVKLEIPTNADGTASEGGGSDVVLILPPEEVAKALKLKERASIDADVESIDDEEEEEEQKKREEQPPTKKRRLKKIRELEVKYATGSSAASAAAAGLSSSAVPATAAPAPDSSSSSAAAVGAAGAAGGGGSVSGGCFHVSLESTPQVSQRRSVRQKLLEIPLPPDWTNAVEQALFDAQGRLLSSVYTTRANDICFNLTANALLRERLLSGALTPDALVRMSNAAMATAQQQQERAAEHATSLRLSTAAPQAVYVRGGGERVALHPSTGQRVHTEDVDAAVRKHLHASP